MTNVNSNPEFVVRLKDYSMLYVDCEAGYAAELSDYFSFFVPGYKFMPQYKNRVWDGKIKLFNRMNGELPAGLYAYLIKFAIERSYSVDTEESDFGFPFRQLNLFNIYLIYLLTKRFHFSLEITNTMPLKQP